MNETEQRDLATRLLEDSDVFDFDTALELVQSRPDRARYLLRMSAEIEKRQEERARGLKRLRRALIEDYG